MSYYGGNEGYGSGGGGGYGQPPPPRDLPYPWRAEWIPQENRYIFINPQNGERTFEFPRGYGGQGASYDGGYGGGAYGGPSGPGGYDQRGYGGGGGGGYPSGPQGDNYSGGSEEHEKKKSHNWMGAALAGAAGLAGGALLMHEGEKVHEHWDEDKDRVEEGFDRFGNRLEDAPEDAARWTGEKVQDVEDIPQNVEQGFDRFGNRIESGWDNAVNDVEDAPEDVANWAGRKVGDVERYGDDVEQYGDRLDNAYDDGRQEGRDDDNW